MGQVSANAVKFDSVVRLELWWVPVSTDSSSEE